VVLLDNMAGVYRWQPSMGFDVQSLGAETEFQPSAVDIAQNAELIAIGGADRLVLRDLSTGESRTLPVIRVVKDIAFSPDDRLVAAGERDGLVEIWDVASGERVAVLRGHSEIVPTVAFSPDGQTLVTGSWDGTLRVWDLSDLQTSPQALVDRAEATWHLTLEQALAASE